MGETGRWMLWELRIFIEGAIVGGGRQEGCLV